MAARATAVIIDSVLVFVVLGTAVGAVTGQAYREDNSVGFNLHGWPFLLWVVLGLAYWTICEQLWGMTIGKRLFSIRVASSEGGAVTWRQSILRNLLRPVDGFPYFIPYLVGFVVAKTNPEAKRLGDRAGGTQVVRPD